MSSQNPQINHADAELRGIYGEGSIRTIVSNSTKKFLQDRAN
jgi:hypothetical protein